MDNPNDNYPRSHVDLCALEMGTTGNESVVVLSRIVSARATHLALAAPPPHPHGVGGPGKIRSALSGPANASAIRRIRAPFPGWPRVTPAPPVRAGDGEYRCAGKLWRAVRKRAGADWLQSSVSAGPEAPVSYESRTPGGGLHSAFIVPRFTAARPAPPASDSSWWHAANCSAHPKHCPAS